LQTRVWFAVEREMQGAVALDMAAGFEAQ